MIKCSIPEFLCYEIPTFIRIKYFDALELQGFDVCVYAKVTLSGMCAIILPSNISTYN